MKKLEGAVRILSQNSDGFDIIKQGHGDKYFFCSFCKLEKTCDRENMPRLTTATKTILRCRNDINYPFAKFPFKGAISDQPVWFVHLWNHYDTIINLIRNKH